MSAAPDIGLDRLTWLAQIECLTSNAVSEKNKRLVLYTMVAPQLFYTALVSPPLFDVVRQFLRFLSSSNLEEEHDGNISDVDSDTNSATDESVSVEVPFLEPKQAVDKCALTRIPTRLGSLIVKDTNESEPADVPSPEPNQAVEKCGLTKIPTELGLLILEDVDYTGRSSFACSASYPAALVAEALRNDAAKLLHRFFLNFDEVRLMQTATGSVLAGFCVIALFRPQEPNQFSVLEIVTPKDNGPAVVTFLVMASKYEIVETDEEELCEVNVNHIWTLQLKDVKIIVFESMTPNPFDVIAQRQLSPLYGAWTANELWMGYPYLTKTSIATTTPSRFPFSSRSLAHRKMWSLMHALMDIGYDIALEGATFPHTCGVDASCPATLRTSTDAGCLRSAFPRWTFSSDAIQAQNICWSMGGEGCSAGHLVLDNSKPRRLSNVMIDSEWMDLIIHYLRSSLPPT
ncbi:hypothetical protein R3P38DRAFT_3175281 [Favolaschia claudopus]|uniref:Uncharacterized protein n=1 Tax=Favolaschia claudopus TaxID=2862362 RepID=A0AAW0DCZ4_9AGAR